MEERIQQIEGKAKEFSKRKMSMEKDDKDSDDSSGTKRRRRFFEGKVKKGLGRRTKRQKLAQDKRPNDGDRGKNQQGSSTSSKEVQDKTAEDEEIKAMFKKDMMIYIPHLAEEIETMREQEWVPEVKAAMQKKKDLLAFLQILLHNDNFRHFDIEVLPEEEESLESLRKPVSLV